MIDCLEFLQEYFTHCRCKKALSLFGACVLAKEVLYRGIPAMTMQGITLFNRFLRQAMGTEDLSRILTGFGIHSSLFLNPFHALYSIYLFIGQWGFHQTC